MEPNKGEEVVVTPTTEIIKEPSQNPLQTELEREENRGKRTEPEKAAYSLQQNAKRVKELGLDPAEILGIKPSDPKGTVVTLEMLEERERERGQKTALQLADDLQNEHERMLVKKYLLERIKPSGDANEDLRFALLAVNSVKNGQIVEELARRGTASSHAAAPGAPAKPQVQEPELTSEELMFTRAPFNLTKEEIIAKRPK